MFKSQEQLIAEIHNEFDTAQERLLTEANRILTASQDAPESIADRLKKIGFVNTPVVKKVEVITQNKQMAGAQAELILHYKHTYPFLKFLTEDELNRICDKYNLIHAPVRAYIKEVPENNLRDIEQAQSLRTEDIMPVVHKIEIDDYYYGVPKDIKDLFKQGVYVGSDKLPFDRMLLSILRKDYGYKGSYSNYIYTNARIVTIDKSGLFIAAPKSHFNIRGLSRKSKHGYFNVFQREIKDPIVFRYVRGGIQVLTKWGIEGEDPMLYNEKFN